VGIQRVREIPVREELGLPSCHIVAVSIRQRLGDKTPGVQAADKASVANAAVELN